MDAKLFSNPPGDPKLVAIFKFASAFIFFFSGNRILSNSALSAAMKEENALNSLVNLGKDLFDLAFKETILFATEISGEESVCAIIRQRYCRLSLSKELGNFRGLMMEYMVLEDQEHQVLSVLVLDQMPIVDFLHQFLQIDLMVK